MTLSLLASLALAALAPQDDVLRVPPTLEQDTRTPVDVRREGTTLRFYEVGDLVGFLQFAERVEGAPAESDQARLERAKASTAGLARLLARHVEPPLADQGEELRAGGPGVLIVMGRAAQHAWVERVLTLQRREDWLLHLEVRYFEGARGSFAAHTAMGSSFVLQDDAQLEVFLQHAQGPGMDVLTAPQVITRSLQEAEISTMDEIAYVKEYRLVVVEPGAKEIADPVIDTVHEGITLAVRGIVLEEGLVGLDLQLSRSQVERPIPTRKVRLSAALPTEVEISLPVVFSSTVAAELALAEDSAVVFVTPSTAEDRDMACLVRVKTIRGELPPPDAAPAVEPRDR